MKDSASTTRARLRRVWIIQQLGGHCARCGETRHLQFDLKASDGGFHHGLSWPQRQLYYMTEFGRGNLQLLCPRCHTAKTLADIKARRAAKLTAPPATC